MSILNCIPPVSQATYQYIKLHMYLMMLCQMFILQGVLQGQERHGLKGLPSSVITPLSRIVVSLCMHMYPGITVWNTRTVNYVCGSVVHCVKKTWEFIQCDNFLTSDRVDYWLSSGSGAPGGIMVSYTWDNVVSFVITIASKGVIYMFMA